MKKILILVLAVIGTIFAVSCGQSSNTTTETANAAMITVDDLLGKEFALTNMYEGKTVTIAFSATNMLGGKAVINNYFGGFTLEGDKIKLSPMGSTKMAGPEEDMNAEMEYLQILNGADTIALDGDVLTITTTSGTNLIYTFTQNVEIVTNNQ
ncbi:META domain-containing protein [Brachyspira pilosicoli]|uniref:META domain-containing protein n=1 Tax=Brachyspira pilosicoli TaxID=52584 RepID=UPI00254280E2|nr:META domain-containing protein [Brachyspira pilosicoli]WIH83819.1 META domain-containing protein [Brachyspira pilosicoli]